MESSRIQLLNSRPVMRGDYVLYWMQQSQRAEFNPALEFAIHEANKLGLPVVVGFGLMDDYPEANLRHYTFMLEGLRETEQTLRARGIQMVTQRGQPYQVALELAEHAAIAVCDRGYLRHQRLWRAEFARSANCSVIQVEGDVVVPVEEASNKAEFAARTIRPKIQAKLAGFLKPLRSTKPKRSSMKLSFSSFDLEDIKSLKLDRSVKPVSKFFRGGTSEAKRRFKCFALKSYANERNLPERDAVSHMSPYLHFGQISPVWLALQARGAAVYLEELIVRRELGANFVHFTPNYDRFESLPDWAKATLTRHKRDSRPVVYDGEQLENCETADPYWNAAMREMKVTGYMHNHMRMYWGKKILEWSRSPEEAFATTLYLNNKYFLDGRDPSSYTNVAWIFGLHDRPWGERAIFGTVRTMTAGGLERKCDIEAYVERINRLEV